VASLANLGSNYINAGLEARRLGTAHASIVPYQSFRTKDGYMTIGCGNDLQYEQVNPTGFCQDLLVPDNMHSFLC
jgi:crotonobetainyl-CoA:carnitine CoA-transferase CaiB-like acyl-CoA transferase